MNKYVRFLTIVPAAILIIAAVAFSGSDKSAAGSKDMTKNDGDKMTEKVIKSDSEWKEILTEEQFRILRQRGTESPFTGEYTDYEEEGVYHCAACGAELFSSSTKFHSGCGWPSYYKPLIEGNVIERTDTSLGMTRTEILCAACESHLGHVFNDGPPPTGLRYCINSIALKFEPAKASDSAETDKAQ